MLRPKGLSSVGADQDADVYVPLQTARRRVFNQQSLSVVFVELAAAGSVDSAAEQVRDALRERHLVAQRGGTDDFDVQDPVKLLAMRAEAARTLSFVSSGLGAISLLVGGTGILALMLLSVRERTSEIGVRMALGARTRDILLQFLAEATALALSGGVAGMALGALRVRLVSVATRWEARVSPQAALVSLGAAAGIGLAFGVVPAVRATYSRTRPSTRSQTAARCAFPSTGMTPAPWCASRTMVPGSRRRTSSACSSPSSASTRRARGAPAAMASG